MRLSLFSSRAVSKFRDESDYLNLTDKSSVWSISPTAVTNYNLFLLLTICNRKSLMIQMWVIIIYYLGYIKNSYIRYFSTTLLLAQHRSRLLFLQKISDVQLSSIAAPLALLGCVSYLAISIVIATLASCDQVSFEVQFVYPSLVCLRLLCQA